MGDLRTQAFLKALEEGRSPVAAAQADVASARDLSPEERGRRLVAVCRAGWEILRTRPDFERAVAWRDPLPPDFERIWARLMARRRDEEDVGAD